MPRFCPDIIPGFCPQPMFIIGTYKEDGTPNFAPISWVSVTWSTKLLLVISMHGEKSTKDNIFRTGKFSANLASSDMVELVDYFGSVTGRDGAKDAVAVEYENGTAIDAPTLAMSKWVYECEVIETLELGESHTFVAEIKSAQIDQSLAGLDMEMIDLQRLDPILWAACNYYSIGRRLGAMGSFVKQP